jgi:predicted phage tail protein|tara:strand:- start:737 stop:1345 length:609 start_codon:yes stop_codon:yes gene_type:complete
MLDCPRKIKLYGDLAEFVGVKEIETEVHTVADAVRCLIGNYPQAENYMMDKTYKVLVNEKPRTLEEIHFPTGQSDIKIIPVISGQGRGFGKIILGAALLVGAFFMPAAAGNLTLMEGIKAGSLAKVGLLTKAMAYVGSSLILYGVAELLTPLPEAPTEETPNSFQFNSPINTSVAGLPVPILYGERMVGSVVISAGIDVINN